ncbi:MAG TPA: MOSC domain-containing protein [Dongiaceae bacterium]|nr:MOSC domain-containing protein [Dongiaceae bacterium]
MHVVSVNAAQPATIYFNGAEVVTGIYKQPLTGASQVTRLGIQGDTIADTTVHGGLDQAIYLYHAEDYDWWSAQLGRTLAPGTFGENLTVSGLADQSLIIGDRLIINDVELEISAPRVPCFKLATKMEDSGFVKAFAKAQRPGAYARVIREGVLKSGDSIALQPTAEDYASVKEVFVVCHQKERPLDVLRRALASPIAAVHRQQLQQWYDDLVLG